MRVLVACEFSGVVRDAFLAGGHDAWSCDLLPTERPGPHVQGDVLDVLEDGWDLMIAHPPCTHLAASGAQYWPAKASEQREALAFVLALWRSPIPRVAMENPVGALTRLFRPPDQYVQPWWFGDAWSKRTGLWLRGLPPLVATSVCFEFKRFYDTVDRSNRSWKRKSVTPAGLAAAMADQWGGVPVREAHAA